jgi:hypothetical protein
MPQLVHTGFIIVVPPWAVDEMIPEGVEVRIINALPVLFLIAKDEPIESIKGKNKPRDLEGWDEVALPSPRLPG